MPRCRPERASICDAPLFLKASVIHPGMSLLSPVIRALAMALAFLSVKGMRSIASCILLPRLSAHIMKSPSDKLAEMCDDVNAHNIPDENATVPVRMHKVLVLNVFLEGCISVNRHIAVTASAAAGLVVSIPERLIPEYAARRTPAVKGNANPAVSLSTLISFLFFANVAIIFITLQRCAVISLEIADNGVKNNLNYNRNDNFSTQLRKLIAQVSAP